MKKIALLLMSILIILSMVSCNSKPTNDQEEKKVLTYSQVKEKIDSLINNDAQFTEMDNDFVTVVMGIDLTGVTDYTVKMQTSGTEIDMYGLFYSEDAGVRENLKKLCEDYLNTMKLSFEDFNYLPAESVKLENAKCIENGNYVLFVVSDDETQLSILKLFE